MSRRTLIQNMTISMLVYHNLISKTYSRERQNALANLKQQISSAWQTDEIRQHRPTPVDEAKWGFATIEQTLWNAVPKFIRELNELVQDNCQQNLPLHIAPVRFASWMGETVMVTRTLLIKLPKKYCGYHAGKLPTSI